MLLINIRIGDARDEIELTYGGRLFVCTRDEPYARGKRIYAPLRKLDISIPRFKPND